MTMKKAAVVALSFACLTAAASAAMEDQDWPQDNHHRFGHSWLDKETQSVRLDYVFADDVGSESANGVEIAFGTALYDLDDVAVYFNYLGNSDMESQQLGLSVQEHFPIPNWTVALIPYVGAGAGYGWLDIDGPDAAGNDPDKSGFVARVEGGALFKVCDYFAFNAGARLDYSANDIFLEEDGGTEDTQWEFVLGARFYY